MCIRLVVSSQPVLNSEKAMDLNLPQTCVLSCASFKDELPDETWEKLIQRPVRVMAERFDGLNSMESEGAQAMPPPFSRQGSWQSSSQLFKQIKPGAEVPDMSGGAKLFRAQPTPTSMSTQAMRGASGKLPWFVSRVGVGLSLPTQIRQSKSC